MQPVIHAKRPTGYVCLEAAAAALAKRGYYTGPKLIFKQLRELGWLDGHIVHWKRLTSGLLAESSGWLDNDNGYIRPWISRQGLDELEQLLPHRNEVEELDLGAEVNGEW